MAQDWKITAVQGDPRPWTSKQGQDNLSYKVTLEGYEKTVEVSRWATKPAPKVGESIYGTIEEDASSTYPPKFRTAKKDGWAGGGRADNPEERRSIERQVAVKLAAGLVPFEPEKVGATWARQLRWVTDQIHSAIEGK